VDLALICNNTANTSRVVVYRSWSYHWNYLKLLSVVILCIFSLCFVCRCLYILSVSAM